MLAIDNDQTGYGTGINGFESGKTGRNIRVILQEIADPLFMGTGKNELSPGIEEHCGRHGAKAVKISIYMGGYDIHNL